MSNISELTKKVAKLEANKQVLYARIGALTCLIAKHATRLDSFEGEALAKELIEITQG